MRPVGWALGAAAVWMLLGTACGDDKAGSSDEPDPDPPCLTTAESCMCEIGTSYRQIDCNGMVIADCMCQHTEECVSDAGCAGTRICEASGSCQDCVCDATLVASGDGTPIDMAWSLDGTAYVLLADAPWLTHVESGNASPLAVRSDSSWAERLVVDADGSLLLFGTACPDTECLVQVQRLSATGELVGSTQWTLDDMGTPISTDFAGAARRSDGSVAVSATSGHLVANATVSADTQVTEVTSVDLYVASPDPQAGNRKANRMALGPADEVVLGGYIDFAGYPEGTWFPSFTREGSVISELIETRYDLFNPFSSSGLTSDSGLAPEDAQRIHLPPSRDVREKLFHLGASQRVAVELRKCHPARFERIAVGDGLGRRVVDRLRVEDGANPTLPKRSGNVRNAPTRATESECPPLPSFRAALLARAFLRAPLAPREGTKAARAFARAR